MANLKDNLINAWRIGSSPFRQLWLQRRMSEGKVPTFVLFYHRIADAHPNPWSMTFEQFRQQIEWFQSQFDIVSLEESQRRIESDNNSRPTLSITFDDGYAENCENALLYLIENKIPVTYFVTTQHTSQQQPFPHDVEQGQPLPVNTIESLRSLSRAGIEIGAHTRTHMDLGSTGDPEVIYDEVISATRELEQLVDQPIRYFAFPFGQRENLNVDAIRLLKRYGIKGWCSAYGGFNEIAGDSFHLQRLHGDPSFSRMKNWLQYDPRIAQVERYDYSEANASIDWSTWISPDQNSGLSSCETNGTAAKNTPGAFESTFE